MAAPDTPGPMGRPPLIETRELEPIHLAIAVAALLLLPLLRLWWPDRPPASPAAMAQSSPPLLSPLTESLQSPAAPTQSPAARKAIEVAMSRLGIPYRRGGTSEAGVDCSGFVRWVYGDVGVDLPRRSRDMARVGTRAPRRDIRPGDLILFAATPQKKRINHVGIALEGGRFIHASSSRGVVIDSLEMEHYARRFVVARRLH